MVKPTRFLAGSVYYVADEQARLPGGDRERKLHEQRRIVLVVSDQNDRHATNSMPSDLWPSVLVVPISSSPKWKTIFDVFIAKGDGNLSKEGWARIPALQVMDKDHLEDMTGQVGPDTLEKVTSQILNYLGIIPPEEPVPDVEPEYYEDW